MCNFRPALTDLPLFVSQMPERELGPYALLPMKPNATFNRHQQNHASILAIADLPASEFAHAHVALAPKLRATTWWDRIFNGKGIWILRQADAIDLFGQYIFAVHDLEAQIALINLKQQLLATDLSGGPLQQALAESPIRNPYRAEEGGRWDEATSELSFDTRPGAPSPSRLPLRVSISKRLASGR